MTFWDTKMDLEIIKEQAWIWMWCHYFVIKKGIHYAVLKPQKEDGMSEYVLIGSYI